MPEFVNPPDLTEDRFTRLWRGADASRGQCDAIAELRERKRRENETSQLDLRRRRDGGRNARHRATLTSQRASGAAPGERIKCERCDRRVEQPSVEWVATSTPAGEPVAHLLCPHCANEVRHGLLRLLGGAESRPAGRPGEQEVPTTPAAQVGWFLLRMAAYGLIGLAVFALVAFSIR